MPGATRRMSLERLEGRELLTTISIADATMNEIGSPSAFVTAGSGGLSSPDGITLGPDGNLVRRRQQRRRPPLQRHDRGLHQHVRFPGLGRTLRPDGELPRFRSRRQPLRFQREHQSGPGVQRQHRRLRQGLRRGRVRRTHRSPRPDVRVRTATFTSPASMSTPAPTASCATRARRPPRPAAHCPPPASPGRPSSRNLKRCRREWWRPRGGPGQLIFGPDGNLYVDGGYSQGINRYDGTTGAFLNTFVAQGTGGLAGGRGMAFDQEGRLYVGDSSDAVHRYDSQGNFLGDLLVNSVNPSLVQAGRDDLRHPGKPPHQWQRLQHGRALRPRRDGEPGRAQLDARERELRDGGRHRPGRERLLRPVRHRHLRAGPDVADDPARDPGRSRCWTATRRFSVQLSNPTGGATIGTGTATVTIVDPTRQFSVADTSAIEGDHTAHYRGAFVQGHPRQSASAS